MREILRCARDDKQKPTENQRTSRGRLQGPRTIARSLAHGLQMPYSDHWWLPALDSASSAAAPRVFDASIKQGLVTLRTISTFGDEFSM